MAGENKPHDEPPRMQNFASSAELLEEVYLHLIAHYVEMMRQIIQISLSLTLSFSTVDKRNVGPNLGSGSGSSCWIFGYNEGHGCTRSMITAGDECSMVGME